MLTSLDKLFREVEEAPYNGAVKRWKESGNKVLGWLCTYTPEELIYAAGILPVRLKSSSENISLGDTYLQSNICPFTRGCLGEGLKKKYNFLDGLIAIHTCDAICKLYDAWRIYVNPPFSHIIDHPHKVSELSYKYHLDQLKNFKIALEDLSGNSVTNEALSKAIDIYNENRFLLKRLYDLRKKESPPISGMETLKVIKSTTLMPKEDNNRILKELLRELEGRGGVFSKRAPRLIMSGSIMDDPSLLQLVEESCGGMVVSDDLCVGTRYFWDEMPRDGDLLQCLSRYYMDKVPCACMHPSEKRLNHLIKMVREFNAKGVIFYGLMFCDTFAYDFVSFKEKLEKEGIPTIQLIVEHPSMGVGQLKTRVEAFIEMIS